jgi:hypothetical protein
MDGDLGLRECLGLWQSRFGMLLSDLHLEFVLFADNGDLTVRKTTSVVKPRTTTVQVEEIGVWASFAWSRSSRRLSVMIKPRNTQITLLCSKEFLQRQMKLIK